MDQRFVSWMESRFETGCTRSAPPADFPSLPPIPGGRYTDPAFLALEQSRLWRRSWLYACHLDELPQPGSYIRWNHTGSPIVVVRGADNGVRAFYNICRHRGAPLVTEDRGLLRDGFVCPYHGWSYGLDGQLQAVRDPRDFAELQTDRVSLGSVRCERFGNWVFLNEDREAEPLLASMGPIASHWRQIDPERLRHVESLGFDVECNVKLMLEAFLEVYHLNSVHKDTAGRFLDHRATQIVLWKNGHSVMVTPNRSRDWVDPGTVGMPSIPGIGRFPLENNLSYNLFPNLITPIAPTGIPFLTFWPTSARTTRVDCHWFAPDWGEGERHPLWGRRIENFNSILGEDIELLPRIQQSVESPAFAGARLGYQERRIYHWHEELDRRIDPSVAAPDLRLEPRLSDFVEQTAAASETHATQPLPQASITS